MYRKADALPAAEEARAKTDGVFYVRNRRTSSKVSQ